MTEISITVYDKELVNAMAIVGGAASTGDWRFPAIEDWMHFRTLEEALPFLATLTAGRRYLWWVSGDVSEALMRRFGRTDGVKARVGAIFGCKVRSVEYRARAACTFPWHKRYADVPVELYRESLSWPDPQAQLEEAVSQGLNSYALMNQRLLLSGHQTGNPIWRGTKGVLCWNQVGRDTTYTITITEEGGTRFAANNIPVMITVSPLLQGQKVDEMVVELQPKEDGQ